MPRKIFLILLILLTSNQLLNAQDDDVDEKLSIAEQNEKIFKMMFKEARAAQLEAIKRLQHLVNKEKQHEMLILMTEQLFVVILENRARIEASGYIPGVSEFPNDPHTLDALTSTLKNTALYADLVLRFPNVVTSLIKENHNWNVLLQWCIAFANQVSYLLDGTTKKLFKLMAQELGYIPRSADYTNPFTRKLPNLHTESDNGEKPKKIRKKIARGPKLNRWEL